MLCVLTVIGSVHTKEKKKRNMNRILRQKKNRDERRIWAKSFLGGKCVVCGATRKIEFDHIDKTTKKYTISSMLNNSIELLTTKDYRNVNYYVIHTIMIKL